MHESGSFVREKIPGPAFFRWSTISFFFFHLHLSRSSRVVVCDMFTIQRDPSSSRNDLFAPARLSESTLANLAPPKRDLFTTVDASNPSLIPSSTDTRFNPSDQTFFKPAGSIPQSSLQQQQQQPPPPPTFQLGSTQLSTFKTPVVPDVKVPSFFVSSEEPSEHQKLDQLRHKRDSAANIFFE